MSERGPTPPPPPEDPEAEPGKKEEKMKKKKKKAVGQAEAPLEAAAGKRGLDITKYVVSPEQAIPLTALLWDLEATRGQIRPLDADRVAELERSLDDHNLKNLEVQSAVVWQADTVGVNTPPTNCFDAHMRASLAGNAHARTCAHT
jgi:hypothetical protein